MQLIHHLNSLPKLTQGAVVTIGNFDGVHLGHQALIKQMCAVAKTKKLPSVVILFEPQPCEVFHLKACPARLTRLREKLEVMANFPIDYVFVLRFHKKLAALSAEIFLRNILVEKFAIKYLVIGDDFKFGCDRKGDFNFLEEHAKKYHYEVESLPTVKHEKRISSTAIREALQKDDFKTAEKLLGRHYSFCGHVVHGNKKGRLINFPTANIYLHRKKSPLSGVYVIRVPGLKRKPIYGVANVGFRPTVKGKGETGFKPVCTLEVHLFDFDKNLYGKILKVEFLHKIREEEKFASFEALQQQIEKDIAVCQVLTSNAK